MENILVSIRVRPLSKQEASRGNPWKLTPKSIALSSGGSLSGQTYYFDRVFDPSSKTVDIYDAHTKKIISSAIRGFNGTIFAYGQTSSGKTYTMRGTSEEPGVIPLAVQDVFRNMELSKDREFLLRVSYMEIYNEEIKDLLSPENCKLQIHENSERGIFVAGLQEEIVDSPEHVLALMDKGEAHRHVGETNMNVHSSRSHAIFRMVIESRDKSQDQVDPEDREILQSDQRDDPVRVSHLNLVDLAGSERIAKTGAEGARLKEGTHINKSLMTLGNVINKLSEGIESKGGHVPYRDSKLTRILQSALGGNARTVIICNVTPALVHVDETKGTLQFASRANRVTNCAQVNEILTDAALLKRQKKEIAELRQKLQNQESPSEQFEDEILNLRNELLKTELERERMALELQEFQKAQAEKERRIKEQQQKIENLSTMVINSAVDDREFEKRSKRNNRRETWCARPQSGLPLLPDLPTFSEKDVPKLPKSTFSEFPVHVRRERSFGLPPPFEALAEEDEDMFTRGTSSSFDEDFQDTFSMNDGFALPEPGPKSSVASRRRRSSNDWIVGNELEQQLLDLQGQYDTLQVDHAIKMTEKDNEIDELKRELAETQLTLSKASKNSHKKNQDSERRGKSLEGWKESESLTTIKQLRAQVGRLETEKLYMERELHRLENQAREQADMSRQYLEEVYEELNLAKETCGKLNAQLDMTLQENQQLQMEKRENEVLYSQLLFALEDLKTEFDDIRKSSGGIQSFMSESLQLLTVHVQEYLATTRDLSTHVLHENKNAKFQSLPPKVSSEDESILVSPVDNLHMEIEHAASEKQNLLLRKATLQDELENLKTCLKDMEDEMCSLSKTDLEEERNNLLSAVNSLHTQIENIRSERDSLLQGGLQDELENLKTCIQVMEANRRSLSETHLHTEGERNSLLSAVSSLQREIEHAVSEKESLSRRKATLQDELENLKTSLQEMEGEIKTNLEEERSNLLSAVASVHMQIENVHSERDKLLLRKAGLQGELGSLQTCIQVIEDERSSLLETKFHGERERNSLISAVNSLQREIEHAASEKESLSRRKATLQDELVNLKSCLQSLEGELSRLREQNSNLNMSLASAESATELVAVEKQKSQLRESGLGREVESLKLSLQAVKEERNTYMKASELVADELGRLETVVAELEIKLAAGFDKCYKHCNVSELSGASSTMFILELETLLVAVKEAASEEERLLRRESALSEELRRMKSSLSSVEDEKGSLSRRLQETQTELDGKRTEIDTITQKIRTSQHRNNVSGELQEPSALEAEIERLIQEKKALEDRVETLQTQLFQSRKDVNRLSSREATLEVEVTNLKSSVEEVKDDRKLWMKVSEERLADVETLRVELQNTKRTLLSVREDFAGAQTQVSDLKSSLSQKLDEADMLNQRLKVVEDEDSRLNKRLKDVEEQKNALTKTVGELERQLQDCNAGAEEAFEEMQGWQQRYQTDTTHYRAEIASLRKELSTTKSLPGALLKERDGLHKDLEKTKSKMKDIEAKLKTTIQDKNKLETEKVNMERELKNLRQSTSLQRDISRRDSVADQRRQSIALVVNKTKNQLSSVELALQLKTDEVENLTYQLRQSHENYAKLEFAMAEAESYSNEKVDELERALDAMKDERDANFVKLERFQSDVNAAKEQCKAMSNEVEQLRKELQGLKEKLEISEGEVAAAKALVAGVTKEKEEIVEQLLDAHMSFQREKAEFTAQAQESSEKYNTSSRNVVLLTEDLQKLKKLQEETSDANRLLQEKLQQALEANTEKSLTRHKQLKEMETELDFNKQQCRELQLQLALAQKEEQDLRLSLSTQVEQLRLELQQCNVKLSTARDEEQVLSKENRSMIYANAKLQVILDQTRDKLEIFEDRMEESKWELEEFKRLLRKHGFVKGDDWNLVSLQEFEKHIRAQKDEARSLETELAGQKMEMIDLEVQHESMRAQCEKYEKEIQYLKTKVLTPEQQTGVREMVLENKKFQAQLKKTEQKAQQLMQLVNEKDAAMNALQMTLESIRAQNVKLEKGLAASSAERESVQKLYNIAMRAGALMSNSKPARPERLPPRATSQSSISLPSDMLQSSGSPTSTVTESSLRGYRLPLSDKPANESPITERKRPRLFPTSERSKLSHTLGLGSRYFGSSGTRSQVDLDKENFTLH
ncbi:unnamed protein product [Calypogeia fissa]